MSSLALQCIGVDDGSNSKIRVKDGSPPMISVIDTIASVCVTTNKYAWVIFGRLSKEVTSKCCDFKFPGRGQKETPVCDFDTIISIMQFLPGENAARNRDKVAETMRRYFAGDQSLHAEIDQNAVSNDPVCRLARATMEASNANACFNAVVDTKREELFQLELEERRVALEIQKSDSRIREREASFRMSMEETANVKEVILFMKNEDMLDGVCKTMFKDYFMNQAFKSKENNACGYQNEYEIITISDVAADKGVRMSNEQLKQAGVLAARLYFEKYHESPLKSRRVIGGGQIREVNTYCRQHVGILSRAIDVVVNPLNHVGTKVERELM
eukprot:767518-Hanusia_phi.AAC.1